MRPILLVLAAALLGACGDGRGSYRASPMDDGKPPKCFLIESNAPGRLSSPYKPLGEYCEVEE